MNWVLKLFRSVCCVGLVGAMVAVPSVGSAQTVVAPDVHFRIANNRFQNFRDNGVGAPMTPWENSGNTTRIVEGYSFGVKTSYTFQSIMEVAGEYEGFPIYKTPVPGIGVQLRYVGGTNPDGPTKQSRNSGANGDLKGNEPVLMVPTLGGWTVVGTPTARFINLGGYSAGRVSMPPFLIGPLVTIADGRYVSVTSNLWFGGFNFTAPPARCSVQYDTGVNVNLGSLTPAQFPVIGATSNLKGFAWSSQCSAGTPGTLEVTYASVTPVTDNDRGRAQVMGGAGGLEFEMRRDVSSSNPEGTPVVFGQKFDVGPSSGPSGPQGMGVRLVRTGTVVPGKITGGITINLSYR